MSGAKKKWRCLIICGAMAAAGPVVGSGQVSGTSGAKDVGLKSQRAELNALLVSEAGGGDGFAGVASTFSGIALPIEAGKSSQVVFNQKVGSQMEGALREVVKYLQVARGGWPKGYRIELAFKDRYSGKDGPSAAVASALLLDSMILGWELEPNIAVTGDMNADGSVQPVGGIGAKIGGAAQAGCELVAVPKANVREVVDLVLLEGLGKVVEIPVFAIDTFDEAKGLAAGERDEELEAAMVGFGEIQKVMRRPGAKPSLLVRSKAVQQRLLKVIEQAPTHLSARILRLAGTGKLGKELSLLGSITAIDQNAEAMMSAVRSGGATEAVAVGGDRIGDELFRLKRLRERVNPAARPFLDSLVRLGEELRDFKNDPPKTRASHNEVVGEINQALALVVANSMKLRQSKEVREALMR